MKDFRTTVSPQISSNQISLKTSILTVGSCFSDAIGLRLKTNKIRTLANPFGNIYNPLSIYKVLNYAIGNERVEPDSYLQHNEVFLNYDFHSEFSSLTRKDLEAKIENTITEAHTFLSKAKVLIITFGTAWVYKKIDTNNVVANCHKMPPGSFNKVLLSQDEIVTSFYQVYNSLKAINPSIRLVLTVSPVRHIKDTLALNSVSKSVLRSACHILTTTLNDVDYFPAYEIMMDDLRDYRFYKSDMIHPSKEAEEYIWQKFITCYAEPALQQFIKEWKEVLSAIAHKPFHPTTTAHQNFLKQTLQRLQQLSTHVSVEEEINLIKKDFLSF